MRWTTAPETIWTEYAAKVENLQSKNLERVAHLQCSLEDAGLQVKRMIREDGMSIYFLIGAPQELLERHAEVMELDAVLVEEDAGEAQFYVSSKAQFRPFSSAQRQRIILDIIETDHDLGGAETSMRHQQADGVITAFFPLHDVKELDNLKKTWVMRLPWKLQPLQHIRDYFGEETAYYFSFVGFYVSWLYLIGAAGLICFIIGKAVPAASNWANSVYAFIIALWMAMFLEFWKRRANKHAYIWDTLDLEEEERVRPEYHGLGPDRPGVWEEGVWIDLSKEASSESHPPPKLKYYPPILTRARVSFALSIIAVLVFMVVVCTIALLSFRIFIQQSLYSVVGEVGWQGGGYIGSIINAITIIIFNAIYRQVAVKLTDWENHRTQQDYDAALIIKVFLFQFANSFTGLFYMAYLKRGIFLWGTKDLEDACTGQAVDSHDNYLYSSTAQIWRGCPSDLESQLVSLLVINITVGQIQEVFGALFSPALNRFKVYCRMQERSVKGSKCSVRCGAGIRYAKYAWRYVSSRALRRSVSAKLEEFEIEAQRAQGDFISEYSELVLQFGYITLFAAVFPLASLLALLNNVIEMRTDALKWALLQRRPFYMSANGIGRWFAFLQIISVMAVINNCLLIGFTYTSVVQVVRAQLSRLVPDKFEEWYYTLWVVLAIEHLLFLLKIAVDKLISDVPNSLKLSEARRKHAKELKFADADLIGQKAAQKAAKSEVIRAKAAAKHEEIVLSLRSYREAGPAANPPLGGEPARADPGAAIISAPPV